MFIIIALDFLKQMQNSFLQLQNVCTTMSD